LQVPPPQIEVAAPQYSESLGSQSSVLRVSFRQPSTHTNGIFNTSTDPEALCMALETSKTYRFDLLDHCSKTRAESRIRGKKRLLRNKSTMYLIKGVSPIKHAPGQVPRRQPQNSYLVLQNKQAQIKARDFRHFERKQFGRNVPHVFRMSACTSLTLGLLSRGQVRPSSAWATERTKRQTSPLSLKIALQDMGLAEG
jgi:hypothetical protein